MRLVNNNNNKEGVRLGTHVAFSESGCDVHADAVRVGNKKGRQARNQATLYNPIFTNRVPKTITSVKVLCESENFSRSETAFTEINIPGLPGDGRVVDLFQTVQFATGEDSETESQSSPGLGSICLTTAYVRRGIFGSCYPHMGMVLSLHLRKQKRVSSFSLSNDSAPCAEYRTRTL